jgi:hypothetical protein
MGRWAHAQGSPLTSGYRLVVTRRYSAPGARARTLADRSCAPPRTITATGPPSSRAWTVASSRARTFLGSSLTLPSWGAA